MKAYAIAMWLITLLEEEQRATARQKISKDGVYSAFHGKWWPRITKSRGDYYGQIDALGTGRVVHMMEDILHLKIPLATMEGHRHLIVNEIAPEQSSNDGTEAVLVRFALRQRRGAQGRRK